MSDYDVSQAENQYDYREPKLKPCPFCGREKNVEFVEVQSNSTWIYYVECSSCDIKGPEVHVLVVESQLWEVLVTMRRERKRQSMYGTNVPSQNNFSTNKY